MFEHIHFTNSYDELHITSADILSKAAKTGRNEIADSFSHSDFHIHGSVCSLSPIPMSPANRDQFMYIQAFSYMTADETYYAKQKYYASYQILFTHNGQGEIIYNKERYLLNKGSVFFIDCTKEQTYYTSGNSWEVSDLHFFGGSSQVFYQHYIKERGPLFLLKHPDRFQPLLEKVLLSHTTVSQLREWNVSSSLENLLRDLLENTLNTNSDIPERIQYLISYIENNYKSPLTLDSLAHFSGLSKYFLSREFKKFTGFSPIDYFIELRLEQAKTILVQTNIPAYKVGILVGMPDEAHFFRTFKKRTGLTPGEFRISSRRSV